MNFALKILQISIPSTVIIQPSSPFCSRKNQVVIVVAMKYKEKQNGLPYKIIEVSLRWLSLYYIFNKLYFYLYYSWYFPTISFQATTSRMSTIDQVLDNQMNSLPWRQLIQGQYRLEHLSHISHGQGGKYFNLKLMNQVWITGIGLSPIQFGFSDKPQGQSIQSCVMHPGTVFASYQFIPASLRLGILEGTLSKISLTAP